MVIVSLPSYCILSLVHLSFCITCNTHIITQVTFLMLNLVTFIVFPLILLLVKLEL